MTIFSWHVVMCWEVRFHAQAWRWPMLKYEHQNPKRVLYFSLPSHLTTLPSSSSLSHGAEPENTTIAKPFLAWFHHFSNLVPKFHISYVIACDASFDSTILVSYSVRGKLGFTSNFFLHKCRQYVIPHDDVDFNLFFVVSIISAYSVSSSMSPTHPSKSLCSRSCSSAW